MMAVLLFVHHSIPSLRTWPHQSHICNRHRRHFYHQQNHQHLHQHYLPPDQFDVWHGAHHHQPHDLGQNGSRVPDTNSDPESDAHSNSDPDRSSDHPNRSPSSSFIIHTPQATLTESGRSRRRKRTSKLRAPETTSSTGTNSSSSVNSNNDKTGGNLASARHRSSKNNGHGRVFSNEKRKRRKRAINPTYFTMTTGHSDWSSDFLQLCNQQLALLMETISDIDLAALFFRHENEVDGQLEFIPLIVHSADPDDNKPTRVWISSGAEGQADLDHFINSYVLPGGVQANWILPDYPFSSVSQNGGVLLPDGGLCVPIEYNDVIAGTIVIRPKPLSSTSSSSQAIRRDSFQNIATEDGEDEGDSQWSVRVTEKVELVAKSIAVAAALEGKWHAYKSLLGTTRTLLESVRSLLRTSLHQIRSPLQALVTFGNLMMRKLPVTDSNRDLAKHVIVEALRVDELLKPLDEARAKLVLPETPPNQSILLNNESLKRAFDSQPEMLFDDFGLGVLGGRMTGKRVSGNGTGNRGAEAFGFDDSAEEGDDELRAKRIRGSGKVGQVRFQDSSKRPKSNVKRSSFRAGPAARQTASGTNTDFSLNSLALPTEPFSSTSPFVFADDGGEGGDWDGDGDEDGLDDYEYAYEYEHASTTREGLQLLWLADVLRAQLERAQVLANSKGLRFKARLNGDSGPIMAVGKFVREAMSNLLDNAIKYSPRGAYVGVASTRPEVDGFELPADSCGVVVWDTGFGFNPDEMVQVWEYGFRGSAAAKTRVGGSGLGLGITEQLLRSCSADIELVSPLPPALDPRPHDDETRGTQVGSAFFITFKKPTRKDSTNAEERAVEFYEDEEEDIASEFGGRVSRKDGEGVVGDGEKTGR